MVPSQDELVRLHADLCSGLADPIRIGILYALRDGEANVTDIVQQLNLPQSTVSRHLSILRAANLVRSNRQGQNNYYQLTDARVVEALDLLRAVLHARVMGHARALDAAQKQDQTA